MWINIRDKEPKENVLIEVEVEHYNSLLNIENKIIRGYMGCDNFYFEDGGELSFNWNIIKWRKVK